MAIYKKNVTSGQMNYILTEQHIYGSSRLGLDRRGLDMIAASGTSSVTDNVSRSIKRGEKHYELSNHLGNVLATVSDKKIAVMSGANLSFYRADVVSYSDYYPFGAPMTERTAVVTPTDVRYGFNGKEMDNESFQGAYDFGARMYDSRLGRWWSVDPLVKDYPNLSPLSSSGNCPISCYDPDGRLIIFINGFWGPGTGVYGGGTADYWGGWSWINAVQTAINDFSNPLFYDGAVGNSVTYFNDPVKRQNIPSYREGIGFETGYSEAENIVSKLKVDSEGNIIESIKFVTNSMGTAFERGMSNGIVKWVAEENFKITMTNNLLELKKQEVLDSFQSGSIDFKEASTQLNSLDSQKKPLLNVNIEMVIDLDSHQVSKKDENAVESFYMLSNENGRNLAVNLFVEIMAIEGAKQIGLNSKGESLMRCHGGMCSPPEEMPADKDNCD